MVLKTFDEIIAKVKSASPKRMAIAVAGDTHTLEAALEAKKAGLAVPVPVGNKREILAILDKLGASLPDSDIYDEEDEAAACKTAVSLVREGKAGFLMKGKVDTKVLLGAVVDKTAGLNRGVLMSHIAIHETPGYHKLLTVADGAMIPYPTLEQKRQIIENTVNTLRIIGYDCPKIGVLACVEKVNHKMPESVEAEELQRMYARG
jgi:phosphate butyryltransferase